MTKKPIGESDDYALLHPSQLTCDRIDAYYSVLSGGEAEYDAELRALSERLRSGLLSYGEPTDPDPHARAALDDFVDRSGRQADRGPRRKYPISLGWVLDKDGRPTTARTSTSTAG